MSIRAIVFDLDGTLIDGYAAIQDALGFAMSTLGFAPPTLEQTRQMVGHGLHSLMEESVGIELASKAVELFDDFYPKVLIPKTKLLPDVPEVLQELSWLGYTMSVASNKPKNFSDDILKATGIIHYFSTVLGPDENIPPKPAPTMLNVLIKKMKASATNTVCVGDMEVDVQFAHAGGCKSIVIPSGSRDRAFLETSGADFIIDKLSALPKILKSL